MRTIPQQPPTIAYYYGNYIKLTHAVTPTYFCRVFVGFFFLLLLLQATITFKDWSEKVNIQLQALDEAVKQHIIAMAETKIIINTHRNRLNNLTEQVQAEIAIVYQIRGETEKLLQPIRDALKQMNEQISIQTPVSTILHLEHRVASVEDRVDSVAFSHISDISTSLKTLNEKVETAIGHGKTLGDGTVHANPNNVAICMNGQMRALDDTFESFEQQVLEPLNYPDLFLHFLLPQVPLTPPPTFPHTISPTTSAPSQAAPSVSPLISSHSLNSTLNAGNPMMTSTSTGIPTSVKRMLRRRLRNNHHHLLRELQQQQHHILNNGSIRNFSNTSSPTMLPTIPPTTNHPSHSPTPRTKRPTIPLAPHEWTWIQTKALLRATLFRIDKYNPDLENIKNGGEYAKCLDTPSSGNWNGAWPGGGYETYSTMYQQYSRQVCGEMIKQAENARGKKYSRVIFTRSDHKYIARHPSMSNILGKFAWVPTGQDMGGINDRHLVLNREHADLLFNLYNLLTTGKFDCSWINNQEWHYFLNAEKFLKLYLERNGAIIKRYPAVSYIVCDFKFTAYCVDAKNTPFRPRYDLTTKTYEEGFFGLRYHTPLDQVVAENLAQVMPSGAIIPVVHKKHETEVFEAFENLRNIWW
jgi:hypothetical protein